MRLKLAISNSTAVSATASNNHPVVRREVRPLATASRKARVVYVLHFTSGEAGSRSRGKAERT